MSSTPNSFNEKRNLELLGDSFESILDDSDEYILSLQLDFSIKYANKGFTAMCLKAYDLVVEIEKTSFFEIIPAFLTKHYKEILANVMAGDTVKNNTFRNFGAKNLPDVYYQEVFKPVKNSQNNVESIHIFIRDITQNYKTENQLAENEAILKGVFESNSDEIFSLNNKYEITSFNKNIAESIEKLTGKRIKLGTNILQHLEKQDFADISQTHKKRFDIALKGERITEVDTFELEGSVKHTEFTVNPIYLNESIVGISAFGKDITQKLITEKAISEAYQEEIKLNKELANRKEELTTKEEELLQSIEELISVNDFVEQRERQINTIFDNSPDIIASIDREYKVNIANRPFRELFFKINKKDFEPGANVKTFLLDQSAWQSYEAIYKSVFEGNAYSRIVDLNDTILGRYVCEECYSPIRNEHDEITEIAIYIKEITEKVKSQEKISIQEKRFTSVINSTDVDGILVVNSNYILTGFNKSYENVMQSNYGITIEADKYSIFDLLPPQFHEDYRQIFDNVLKGETQHKETMHPIADGKHIYTTESFFPIFDNDNKIVEIAVFIRDVTESVVNQKLIKDSEEMLRETQEIAVLGSWQYVLATGDVIWSDVTYAIYEIPLGTKIDFNLFQTLHSEEENALISEIISNATKNKCAYKLENKYVSPTGIEKCLLGIGNPISDTEGNLIEFRGSIQDITDRKKAEQSLELSLQQSNKLNEILAQRELELTSNEEELRSYVDELSLVNKKLEEKEQFLQKNIQLLNLTGLVNKVGGWEYDVAMNKYYFTDQMYLMRGLKVGDELNFNKMSDFYNETDKLVIENNIKKLFEKGDPFDSEMEMTTQTGSKIWVRSVGYAEMSNGKTIKAYGAVQDITKRKQDRQKILDSEANLKAIINSNDFSIWAVSNDLKFIAFNEEFTSRYKSVFKREPREGMDALEGVNAETLKDWKEFYDKALSGEKFKAELGSEGTIFEYHFNPIKNSDGSITGVAIIGSDISQKRTIEKQIKLSEQKFRALFEKARVSMMIIDKDNIIDCNDHTLNLLQLSDRSELNSLIGPILKQSSFDGFSVVHKSANIQKIIDSHEERVFEWSHVRKDGKQLYGEIRVTPIEIDGKEVLFSQFYDLTDRKVAENKILESENFLNSIIDNIPIGIMIIDQEGEVQRMNNAILALTSIPVDWHSRSGIHFRNDSFLKEIGATYFFESALEGKVIINQELQVDFGLSVNEWNMRNDLVWFLVTAFPIYENKKVKNVVVALIDVSADKKNKEQIESNAHELVESNKKMAEYKLMALRSVMNPHFLFNSLNSIQYFIAKNDREQALNYLSLFSKLIRSILNSSIDNSHSLAEEISILRFYTDLETLRFENKFITIFHIEESIDLENIEIPSLILQPYVENAILHGLYNKAGEKGVLRISFKLTDNERLLVSIEDNGVGRIEALEIKQASKIHRSVGMLVTQERLALINKNNNLSVTIVDLKDENNLPNGTRVEVLFNI
ncbi:MAG: PAS domain S-box protein [Cytophagales bacterium]